jgi:hypothetical protein
MRREAKEYGTDRRVPVQRANPSSYERDPIECPECGNVAQWRRTVYRCKVGHEWRPS